MDFADESARRVFFCYALPCLEIYVKFEKIEIKTAEQVRHDFGSGKDVPQYIESFFVKAKSRCETTAKNANKDKIDSEAVRQCFLFEHDKYVDEDVIAGIKINALHCKTYPGKIVYIMHDKCMADVKTIRSDVNLKMAQSGLFQNPIQMLCRRELCIHLSHDEYVSLHRQYICEVIDKETVDKMLIAKGYPAGIL